MCRCLSRLILWARSLQTNAPDGFEESSNDDIFQVARKMKADGIALEKIALYTGLKQEVIEQL